MAAAQVVECLRWVAACGKNSRKNVNMCNKGKGLRMIYTMLFTLLSVASINKIPISSNGSSTRPDMAREVNKPSPPLCGFKEIEVGFPAASDTDFDFVRKIAKSRQPNLDDVAIQVSSFTCPRGFNSEDVDAVQDGKNVIIHMYNATSPLFRQTVFQASKAKTIDLAVRHAELRRSHPMAVRILPGNLLSTEPEFAVEICEAVKKAWFHGKDMKKSPPIIFNLPATVEVSTPNVYADQIEYFSRNISDREHCHISLHTHNDRGTGVAATELGLMAGGDRVEDVCSEMERTGNVDLVTVALNMYSHGLAPNLDFSNIKEVIDVVTECNDIPVHPRHPYSGDLVFTAFSGSHQDAIKKGKGGVAYLIQEHLGLDMPRKMQVAFYGIVQNLADRTGREMTVDDLTKCFRTAYHLGLGHEARFQLQDYSISNVGQAEGKTQIDPLLANLYRSAIGSGSETKAASYVELKDERGRHVWGVGVDGDVTTSLLKAIISAANTASISAQQQSDEIFSKVVGTKPHNKSTNPYPLHVSLNNLDPSPLCF
ncbi:hypothetical protein H4Q26_015060 [Puccinia striiformis f. sp. tritici PST-130]|nr:hypothetical protein H4Q26_015060 [Puccinia striiformis f. sp. tritici PST-130]